jgi:4-oxalmesaconate hydratase
MIIDCHGHYTTAPKALGDWRDAQLLAHASGKTLPSSDSLHISDDEIRESLEGAQLRIQRERGTDITIFSPRASFMAHHLGNQTVSEQWASVCNSLIHRVTQLYPRNFVGACMLPQSPGVSPQNCVTELERAANELGFVACNLNPDPSGGHCGSPFMTSWLNWTCPPWST